MVSLIILALAGLILSASLFSHKQLFVLLAVGVALTESLWLLLTWIGRVFFQLQTSNVYLFGSIAALVLAVLVARAYKPHIPWGQKYHDLKGDVIAIVTTCIVVFGAFLVVRANGFNNNAWVTHGFYNGDTATFISLVQRSLRTPGLVQHNPFAGGGALEYPTLLHAGVAGLFNSDLAGSWLYYLPTLTYATIAFTIPLLFFLVTQVAPKRSFSLAGVAAVGLVVTASWDSYIYPQSHFFLLGLFVFLAALLHAAYHATAGKKHIFEALGIITAFVLLLSNAVMGTAAAAAIGVYMLIHATPTTKARLRGWYALGAVAVLATFIIASPGNGALGSFGFSYTAAPDMLRLAPLMTLLVAGIVMKKKSGYISLTTTLLMVFAFFTFIFSGRDIVVANASRFFYQALLVGLALLVEPLDLLLAWAKKNLRLRKKDIVLSLTQWGVALVVVGLLVFPSLTSGASAYDNLLRKDTQTVDTAMRSALWWIDGNTDVNAIFLASPQTPFAIPLFTGRSLLRTDYWLSPHDIVLTDIQAAFGGDVQAMARTFNLADYIVLTKDERGTFEPLPSQHIKKVFDNNAVVIYKLK